MFFRPSILLVLSVAIAIVSANSDIGENHEDVSMNGLLKYGQFRKESKAISRSYNKRKNIRKSNKKKEKKKGKNNDDIDAPEISNSTLPTSLQESCKCGLANKPPRIIGGAAVQNPRKYPWLVFLKVIYGWQIRTCTATLISSGHVLTAAHCVHTGKKYIPNKFIRAFIGYHNIMKKDDNEETSIMKVKVIKHPNFKLSSKGVDYDIALLKLEKQLNLDQFQEVRPICLPEDTKSTYFNIEAICAGWGMTKLSNFMISNTPYEITLTTTNDKCSGYKKKVTDSQICTEILWFEATPSYGDSGGPLMVEDDGRFVQIGLVSGGLTKTGKVGEKAVGVFTSVSKLLKWITSKIKDDNRCI